MIQGVKIKELKKNEDNRGWLAEIYRNDEIEHSPAMSYISSTKPNVIRGPHEHKFQTDFFIFMGQGTFKLFLWDNRTDSNTYTEKMELEVGENNKVTVIVPPGVVHGLKCISENEAWCINLPNKLYAGINRKDEVDEIRYENNIFCPFQIS